MQARIKVIVPIAMNAAGVSNRRAQLDDRLIAPGFVPEFAAVPGARRWATAITTCC